MTPILLALLLAQTQPAIRRSTPASDDPGMVVRQAGPITVTGISPLTDGGNIGSVNQGAGLSDGGSWTVTCLNCSGGGGSAWVPDGGFIGSVAQNVASDGGVLWATEPYGPAEESVTCTISSDLYTPATGVCTLPLRPWHQSWTLEIPASGVGDLVASNCFIVGNKPGGTFDDGNFLGLINSDGERLNPDDFSYAARSEGIMVITGAAPSISVGCYSYTSGSGTVTLRAAARKPSWTSTYFPSPLPVTSSSPSNFYATTTPSANPPVDYLTSNSYNGAITPSAPFVGQFLTFYSYEALAISITSDTDVSLQLHWSQGGITSSGVLDTYDIRAGVGRTFLIPVAGRNIAVQVYTTAPTSNIVLYTFGVAQSTGLNNGPLNDPLLPDAPSTLVRSVLTGTLTDGGFLNVRVADDGTLGGTVVQGSASDGGIPWSVQDDTPTEIVSCTISGSGASACVMDVTKGYKSYVLVSEGGDLNADCSVAGYATVGGLDTHLALYGTGLSASTGVYTTSVDFPGTGFLRSREIGVPPDVKQMVVTCGTYTSGSSTVELRASMRPRLSLPSSSAGAAGDFSTATVVAGRDFSFGAVYPIPLLAGGNYVSVGGTMSQGVSFDGGSSWPVETLSEYQTPTTLPSPYYSTLVGMSDGTNIVPLSAHPLDTSTLKVTGSLAPNDGNPPGAAKWLPALTAISTSTAPVYTDNDSQALSTDLAGNLRTVTQVTTIDGGALEVRVPSDPMARAGTVDEFGAVRTSTQLNQIDIPFFRGAVGTLVTVTTANGGTATSVTGGASFATSTNVNGSVTGVSPTTVLYRGGSEVYAYFTAAFTTPTSAASYQRMGLYNAADGFFLGYSGTTFQTCVRNNTVDTCVSQASWNIDTLTGAAGSKFTRNGAPEAINLTYLNVYRVRFGWLGAAPIEYEVLSPDGEWVTFHQVRQPNTVAIPSIENPDLPMTVEVVKTASDATNLVVFSGCWAAGTTTNLSKVTDTITASTLMNLSRSVLTGETTAGGGGYVNVKVSPSGAIQVGGAVALDELPAAAALADASANPTTTTVGSALMGYNGTTWDRLRSTIASGLLVDVSDSFLLDATFTGRFAAGAALTDNFANPTTTQVGAMHMLWDGATWDRAPGNSTDGMLVNLGTNNDVTVTGTVTANAGTGNFATNLAQYGGVAVGVGNALHVQPGTGASFTVAQGTAANLRAQTASESSTAAAIPAVASAAGFSDGTNLQIPRVADVDTSGGGTIWAPMANIVGGGFGAPTYANVESVVPTSGATGLYVWAITKDVFNPVSTSVTCANTATAAPGSVLSGRTTLTLVNNDTVTIYLGGTAVTTSSGIPLLPGASFTDDVSSSTYYCIVASGTANLRVLEN